MILRSFTRRIFKTLLSIVSCEYLLSKATGNSDSQNAILEKTENTSIQEVEVRK